METFPLELCTMPGFAGSSAYYLRYEDPRDAGALVSKEANQYWRNVDLYVGGIEHATGHLVYSRFWNKFLFDIGAAADDEPFKKLVNQGMIQGRSNFVYRLKDKPNTFVSAGLKDQYETTALHVDVNIVANDILDLEKFREWRPEFAAAEFILEDGKYACGWAVEKMSKSMYNVVNPDDIVDKFGADTLRIYEMFLGPIEQSKPWDTSGIEGVYRFLRRSHRLIFDQPIEAREMTVEESRLCHATIKKVTGDIESLSLNTAISQLMIFLNGFAGENKSVPRQAAEAYVVMLSPFAPHICEELWEELCRTRADGGCGCGCGCAQAAPGVSDVPWPEYDENLIKVAEVEILVQVSGKPKARIMMPAGATQEQMQELALADAEVRLAVADRPIRKVIAVPGRLVNIVA
jgi:Leucyl-tRNA synthetase